MPLRVQCQQSVDSGNSTFKLSVVQVWKMNLSDGQCHGIEYIGAS